tara:strand:- start:238 stop:654 length:417 start_codon:yes stop_codon:yes gene_type:complete
MTKALWSYASIAALVTTSLSSLVLVSAMGCALHAKIYTDPNEVCCERLDTRRVEMVEFNRYCTMIVFADRKEKNPKILEDIKRRLNLCKYVFGVPRDQDLMSHLQSFDQPVTAWRQVYHDFWNPPVSCDPAEIHCEEF